ncbi:glutamyl-tRNA reductase [Aggregicoccus sp. 17bor-14]|uniref:glutamyl-tRNA reductase n=1 Tax=Myxococcaceae TaxID=31 RepID=UPI00129C78B3|nr:MULTISPECIES: glutamyl-tRNA reductase [Myxococcaceae]MBF5041437.1 glutamyl-tRNA reductase [Simulacricoccus sp. 17bor-14]MRI87221.1 glutamyl-tRNA reductase [Aggregicoccus sp. 17bor-14]
MELLCIGLSHRSAPLAVRERLALPEPRQVELTQRLAQAPSEALVVSTCNRVELYVAAQDGDAAREQARAQLSLLGGPEALDHLYEHRGEAALVHLFRVASSLDSMVLGEAQILGQVKEAFERAQGAGAVRGELTRVCAAAFGCAKRVRTETAIGRSATSMASAAVALASKVFDGLHGKTVLVVGAGEMGEHAARHLRAAGASRLVITNRTLARAEALAREVGAGCEARPFEELQQLLTASDVVVCSTASPVPIFTKENVGAVGKARKLRPLFMVDLAVPRDIAPDVGELPWVTAYDVDDIQKFVADNAAARAGEAEKASVLVAQEVARFVKERSLREGLPVLARLRKSAEEIARAEVERTLAAMGDGLTERQRKSIEAMGRAIVNKLLHGPTAKLRAVHLDPDSHPDGHRLAGAAAELFGLAEAQEAVRAEAREEGRAEAANSDARSAKG